MGAAPGEPAKGIPSQKETNLCARSASAVDDSGSVSSPTPCVNAVLWDLDGTLYHQAPLRRRMLMELAWTPLTRGLGARRILRRLRSFRRVREELRERGRPEESLERLQYAEPARRIGEDPEAVEATVAEWMYERPLRHLRRTRRGGIEELLSEFSRRGLRLGIFSDYPAEAKLAALGLEGRFKPVLCATDRAINAFKPHPAGFLAACEAWGLEPGAVLYVGDREDVDGVGARNAGMRTYILGPGTRDLQGVKDAVLG